ncbi:hypothetical protein H4582DRAFT_2076658 [Lactarius indigo]|nr:hypothetical protein H4582DRAFT_2076658 [Lactarius indigo]
MSDIQKASKEKDIDMSIKDVHLTFTRTYTGVSNPEDDASSGLESFDEDDMYGSDNGDDIICNIPDTDEESQELEHSLDRLNELINASQCLCVDLENIYILAVELYNIWNRGDVSEHDSQQSSDPLSVLHRSDILEVEAHGMDIEAEVEGASTGGFSK